MKIALGNKWKQRQYMHKYVWQPQSQKDVEEAQTDYWKLQSKNIEDEIHDNPKAKPWEGENMHTWIVKTEKWRSSKGPNQIKPKPKI